MYIDFIDADPDMLQLSPAGASWRTEHRLQDVLRRLAGSLPEQRERLLAWKCDLATRLSAIAAELERAKEVERALDWADQAERLLDAGLNSLPCGQEERLARIAALARALCQLEAAAPVTAVQ